ncbi:MAG TPA: cyclic nucleotide-binding domain-containing protein [Solirubrobacteraceae bacterium]|nr:cyclic nucleotide-binding domain-containing protein [Solirubrobacteraceae bacterium]
MSSGLAAAFFDYGSGVVRVRTGEFGFLSGRSPDDWAKVLDHTEIRRFSAGEEVISAGDGDRALYLLTEGALELRLPSPHARTLRTIDAPSVIGEVAFLDGGTRSATLLALTDGEVLRLRIESFEALSAREPELGRAILFDLARIVTARLRQTNDIIGLAGG